MKARKPRSDKGPEKKNEVIGDVDGYFLGVSEEVGKMRRSEVNGVK